MRREVSLEEISDGRRYRAEDMVRADCGDCRGCSDCCRGMGTSIVLDPLDVYRICRVRNCTPEQLLQKEFELSLVDGLILPNLKMQEESNACAFLNAQGRCEIHQERPGICRLFPLGRLYEDGGFSYFLQIHECSSQQRTKVKVKKWIDMDDLAAYERYVNEWHYFLKAVERQAEEEQMEEAQRKTLGLFLLKQFYLKPYEMAEGNAGIRLFYQEFEKRLEEARSLLGISVSA